jgi:4-hydroxy-tetrahydrodipicolinate synthase
VTPFREDERIDFDAWQAIVEMLIAAGVDGLFLCGSSGEFYALETEERLVALRFVKQAIAGRVPLCANVGAISTAATVRLAQQAEEIGVEYVAVVTPYYLTPTQQEVADHYVEVCRAVRCPVLAYNFPQHGGIQIAPETLGRIAERCDNLLGIKDSSGNLEQTMAYRTAAPGRELAVFIGNDGLLLPALERGCVGTVAACANLVPGLFVELYRAFRGGDRERALHLQTLISQFADLLMLHTFPSVIKEAMRMAGLPAGPCRRPIGPAPADVREKILAVVGRLREEGFLATLAKRVIA